MDLGFSRWIDRTICSPHREHLPGCECQNLGRPLKYLEKKIMDSLVVELNDGFVPPNSALNPVIIYCHGNRRNICSCVHMIPVFRKMSPAATLVLFDYAGFGQSADSLSTEPYSSGVLSMNVLLVLQAVQHEFACRDTFIYGHSLGAAILARVASMIEDHYPIVKGIILEGVPYRLSWIAPWWLGTWVSWWLIGLDTRYPIAEDLKNLNRLPLLLFHSKDDEVVPFDHQRCLRIEIQEKGKEAHKWHTLSGPHAIPNYDADYIKALREFMARAMGFKVTERR